MTFRNATPGDLPAMKHLYASTIRAVCSKDYDVVQIDVWASSVLKEERWLGLVRDQYVLLAEVEGKLAGFASLRDGNYIDFFYVGKDFQRQGIAAALMRCLEAEALRSNALLLSSDVSITARPFFERCGFRAVMEQENVRRDVVLINYKMIRHFPHPGMNPALKAVFMVEHSFKITGRGLVFAGRTIEGEVSPGDAILFRAAGKLYHRQVRGIDMFSGAHRDPAMIALEIRCENEAETEELRQWKPFHELALISAAS